MSDNGGSTDEEELDITSEKFNPLKALLSKKFKYPVQVEPLDNLATIESRIKAGGLDTDLSQIRIASKNKPGRSEVVDQERYHVTNLGRVFRKDQAPTTREKPLRLTKNLLSKMDSYIGPLETLKKYQESHTRVKVFTRKKTGIRGFVTGYIELFDKHFNIALTDCFEKWKRRKYCFSENKVSHGEPQDCSEMLAKLGISLPETEVKSLNRKYVEISRKVPQLLIRGEQVVLITLDQEAEAEKETPS